MVLIHPGEWGRNGGTFSPRLLCIEQVSVFSTSQMPAICLHLDCDLIALQLFTPSHFSEDSEEKDVKTKKDDSHSAGKL